MSVRVSLRDFEINIEMKILTLSISDFLVFPLRREDTDKTMNPVQQLSNSGEKKTFVTSNFSSCSFANWWFSV